MTNPPGAMPPLPEPEGWLYDWTHSSALGKPDEEFTSFTKDEAYAKDHHGHRNARPVYAAPLIARVAELQAALEKLTLSKIDRECLRIGQQIHRAAGDLPETYEIEIEIERGSGSVYLCKPDYTKVAFNDHVDGLSESIKDAIDAAIAAKD